MRPSHFFDGVSAANPVIDAAIDSLADAVTLRERDEPTSHTAILVDDLDA